MLVLQIQLGRERKKRENKRKITQNSNANFPKNNCKLVDSYEANNVSFFVVVVFILFSFYRTLALFLSFCFFFIYFPLFYLSRSLWSHLRRFSFIWRNDVTNCKVPTFTYNSYHFSISVFFFDPAVAAAAAVTLRLCMYGSKKFSSLLQSFPLLCPHHFYYLFTSNAHTNTHTPPPWMQFSYQWGDGTQYTPTQLVLLLPAIQVKLAHSPHTKFT